MSEISYEVTSDHPDLIEELNEYGKTRPPSREVQSTLQILNQNTEPLAHGSIMDFKILKEWKGYTSDCMFPYSLKGQFVEWGIDEQTALFLTGLVAMLRPKICLETGTNRGRSTRAIAEGLLDNPEGHLWTVDMQDYGLFVSGALTEEHQKKVTQVIGKLPGAFDAEPLKDLSGIEFAFVDAGHKGEQLAADLDYIDQHRAEQCWVAVHDTNSFHWNEISEYMQSYEKHPVINLRSMNGTALVWMRS